MWSRIPKARRKIGVSINEPDAVLTVSEVSDYLKLAESTVYRLAKEKKLPGRKVGGAWRFSRKGLEEWLMQSPDESGFENGKQD
ncbi:MAG TPA: DNA-binding protein [Chloroflexi bacterium]|jgi:excisionase family DNA binding protein|nr:DNA-binding protein [Chloroflexota bacterium]